MTVLNKILRQRNRWHAILSGIGMLIGLTLLILTLQLRKDLNAWLAVSDADGRQLIVLSKRIRTTHTLRLASAAFTETEITELESRPFVADIGVFRGNLFPLTTAAGGALFVQSDLFVESVPRRFLDSAPDDWKWSPDSPFLPVILSRDFLNLYNLAYAPSRGLPQLSEAAIRMLPIPLRAGPPENHMTISAKIVGVTDRFSSILVPETFLTWANRRFAPEQQHAPARLVVDITGASETTVSRFLEENGYSTNRERLRDSAAASAAQTILTLACASGLLLTGLAWMVSVLNAQLTVTRSRTDIRLLLDLGYRSTTLAAVLMRDHLIVIMLAGAGAVTLAHLALAWLHDRIGPAIDIVANRLAPDVYPVTAAACLVLLILQAFMVTGAILRIGTANQNR